MDNGKYLGYCIRNPIEHFCRKTFNYENNIINNKILSILATIDVREDWLENLNQG
jgi:hypothetical protein